MWPNSLKSRGNVSLSCLRLGTVERSMGNWVKARALFNDALGIGENLSEIDSDQEVWKNYQWESLIDLGYIDKEEEKLEQARKHYASALTIAQEFSRNSNIDWRINLSKNYIALGNIEEKLGNIVFAKEYYLYSLSIFGFIEDYDRNNIKIREQLWKSHVNIGDIEKINGNLQKALRHFKIGLEIGEALLLEETDVVRHKRSMWVNLWKLADLDDSNYPWTLVQARLEEMQSDGILEPGDQKWLDLARQLAASPPPAG